VLKGRLVHYVPGWDCHGLPIELKALGELGTSGLTPLQIRQKGQEVTYNECSGEKVICFNIKSLCAAAFSSKLEKTYLILQL